MRARKIKNKKAYMTVMLILLVIVSICEIVAIRKYVEQKREVRLFWIECYNMDYRDALKIYGNYNVSVHGIEYTDQKLVDTNELYQTIAFIRVFNQESAFDYDDVPTLLKEYDLFCETGDNSEMLDRFALDYRIAWNQLSANFWRTSDLIYLIKKGNIYISNNEVVRVENDSPEFDEEYLQMVDSVNGDEGLAACIYYEKHSDLLNAWLKENSSSLYD